MKQRNIIFTSLALIVLMSPSNSFSGSFQVYERPNVPTTGALFGQALGQGLAGCAQGMGDAFREQANFEMRERERQREHERCLAAIRAEEEARERELELEHKLYLSKIAALEEVGKQNEAAEKKTDEKFNNEGA